MTILILKNMPSEGPGTIEDFLRERGIQYKIVDCHKETIPTDDDFEALVMLGGPMSVNEEDAYPFLRNEISLARESIDKGKKVFGVCLGAQIMARALGAKVYRGPQPEIGWYDIELTEEGISDQRIERLAMHPKDGDLQRKFEVFHWHGETFDLPVGAIRMASSDMYPNQAFRYGDKAYAFQFHIEVKKEMIYEWLRNEPVDMGVVGEQTDNVYEEYLGRAMNFYRAFF
jgi:GMP synthase (glutamine-hydrolysing)